MRQWLSLVLLACFVGTQALGENCAVSAAHGLELAARTGHGSYHDHGSEAPRKHSGSHAGGCEMLVPCGSAVLPAMAGRGPAPAPAGALEVAFAPSFYVSLPLSFDTPPPRLRT